MNQCLQMDEKLTIIRAYVSQCSKRFAREESGNVSRIAEYIHKNCNFISLGDIPAEKHQQGAFCVRQRVPRALTSLEERSYFPWSNMPQVLFLQLTCEKLQDSSA